MDTFADTYAEDLKRRISLIEVNFTITFQPLAGFSPKDVNPWIPELTFEDQLACIDSADRRANWSPCDSFAGQLERMDSELEVSSFEWELRKIDWDHEGIETIDVSIWA